MDATKNTELIIGQEVKLKYLGDGRVPKWMNHSRAVIVGFTTRGNIKVQSFVEVYDAEYPYRIVKEENIIVIKE